jgi:hypothetical protein
VLASRSRTARKPIAIASIAWGRKLLTAGARSAHRGGTQAPGRRHVLVRRRSAGQGRWRGAASLFRTSAACCGRLASPVTPPSLLQFAHSGTPPNCGPPARASATAYSHRSFIRVRRPARMSSLMASIRCRLSRSRRRSASTSFARYCSIRARVLGGTSSAHGRARSISAYSHVNSTRPARRWRRSPASCLERLDRSRDAPPRPARLRLGVAAIRSAAPVHRPSRPRFFTSAALTCCGHSSLSSHRRARVRTSPSDPCLSDIRPTPSTFASSACDGPRTTTHEDAGGRAARVESFLRCGGSPRSEQRAACPPRSLPTSSRPPRRRCIKKCMQPRPVIALVWPTGEFPQRLVVADQAIPLREFNWS